MYKSTGTSLQTDLYHVLPVIIWESYLLSLGSVSLPVYEIKEVTAYILLKE